MTFKRLKIRHPVPVLAMLTGLLLIFSFQNCSDPMGNSLRKLASENAFPFAYDTKLDQLAYMSCAEMPEGYSKSGYFSFRVGAYYSGSGIKLSSGYWAATGAMPPASRAEALSGNPLNAGAVLQVAIRQVGNYQSVLAAGQMPLPDLEYDNMLASLDSPGIGQPLATLPNNQARINYFGNVSGLAGRTVEGSLRFVQSEAVAKSVRDYVGGSGGAAALLTVAYSDANGGTLARSEIQGSGAAVYGTGYSFQFSAPAYSNTTVRRIPYQVTEYDLQTSQSTGSAWSCPATMQFRIVRPQDIDNGIVYCARTADAPPSTQYQAAYTAIRNVLPQEEWYVDLVNQCVVPKDTSYDCYGSNQVSVNYYTSGCGVGTNYQCPHFVSVCLRQ